MDIQPFSIYVDNRPFRIAFLVNPALGTDWVDRIIAFNREKWGGKFNPIIFTDGNTMAEDWWKFLRGYDPDIIYSTVSLSDELRKKIHIFLSPLRVEQAHPEHQYISLYDRPISILPTGKNVSRVDTFHFDARSDLVLFEVDDTTPAIIKSFLDRNFGLLEQGQMMTYHLKKALETCQIKKYKVTDESSLNVALLDLGEWRVNAVFPAQICALPNSMKEAERSYQNERFEIIVGDSVDEVTHFWNRTLELGAWLRTHFTQLWLPKQLADSEALKSGLGKILNRFVASTGNDHSRGAHFVTFSLTEVEIQAVKNSFDRLLWHPRTSTCFTQHPMPDYEPRSSFFFLRQGLEFHRANSSEERLVLEEPDVEQGGMGGEHWFVDLYIQYHPERFKNIIGKDYWWQLPRRNSILRHVQFFNQEARINESGMFSVLMRRRTSVRPDDTMLVVKIPDDRAVFHALLCGEGFDCVERDDQKRFLSRPFYHLQRSDKGMYLSGVLGLFPDLLNAHHLFEERYWRTVFERMSNHNLEKDETVQKELVNKLTKKINSGMDLKGSDKAKEWLAHNVLNIAKKYSKEEIDLSYATLSSLAKQETDEYNKKPSGSTIEFDDGNFQEKLSDLIDIGVLLLGVKPRCHRCGYRIWYQVGDIQQKITCRGCGYEFSLPAEPTWSYRLNSLIRAAVSLHGTVPLLLALGQMMWHARSAAMFMPSVDLLTKDGDNDFTIYGELDLVCVRDGKFVIGEIKQSIGLFDIHDFTKMADIAKLVRPDEIIFSSMDREPTAFVREKIQELKEQLADLEIEVAWYPLNYWVLDARPVR